MDRRVDARLDVKLPCHVEFPHSRSRLFVGLTENMSRSGILVQWNGSDPALKLPRPGQLLTAQIELPTNRQRAIAAAEQALKEAERAAAGPQEERSPYMTWYAPPRPEGIRKRIARLREEGGSPLRCEIQVIKMGRVALLGWPGEIFCDFGMEVKQRSAFHPTYTIGYANGSIGYVPTPEAFEEGGYEADTAAHLADNAGPVLVRETLSLLNTLG